MAFREFDQPQVSRRSLLRGGLLLGAGTALAGVPLGRQLMAHGHAASWPAIRATVESYVAEGKVANMLATMGWGQNDPEVIARGVLTLGRNVPADQDSLYRIYSMTKPITGIAAMMLVEDGKLALDQPLAEILPAYANMMVQKEYDGGIGEGDLVPAERPITIRQLLTHTAGLGYGIIQKGPIRAAYEERGLVPGQVSRVPIPGLGRAQAVGSLEAFANGLAKVPLVLQPGAKWSYSVSLDLLGRVIEVASGQSFDAFLKARLFDPLGMTSTFFRVPESEQGRFTTNYGILNGMPLPIDPADSSIYLDEPAFPFGGAGLVSSPRDYDRFQRMLVGGGALEGTRVMAEATVRLATSNLLPEGAETVATWVAGEGFGAGGRVTGTAFGWGGAAGTAAFVDMASGLRAALFTQYMPSEAYPIQRGFPDLVMQDLAAMKGA
ncbi:serine hydrolase domain-containing protein [Altererythrobacter sp. H2]|uniref:serine hydrolase domain-containing protein n=1 Tax=Altererythrobacter sp. H2 TaxID=3108391 RepID=UPI002B4BABCC|nr:serine hydrolase domain-containing protein [Altererythrobacter sp. H2]WRK96837.1 serine hydrolase domain-containing protein [Altererythrobacter sp. H2]